MAVIMQMVMHLIIGVVCLANFAKEQHPLSLILGVMNISLAMALLVGPED